MNTGLDKLRKIGCGDIADAIENGLLKWDLDRSNREASKYAAGVSLMDWAWSQINKSTNSRRKEMGLLINSLREMANSRRGRPLFGAQIRGLFVEHGLLDRQYRWLAQNDLSQPENDHDSPDDASTEVKAVDEVKTPTLKEQFESRLREVLGNFVWDRVGSHIRPYLYGPIKEAAIIGVQAVQGQEELLSIVATLKINLQEGIEHLERSCGVTDGLSGSFSNSLLRDIHQILAKSFSLILDSQGSSVAIQQASLKLLESEEQLQQLRAA